MKVLLASASPRRSELLTQIGIEHKVITSKVREDYEEHLAPQDVVMELAMRKAKDVARKTDEVNAIIIGADTVVVFRGEIMGKPKNAKNAKEMLEKLSGHTHEVLTGIAIIDMSSGKTLADYECTKVTFRVLTPKEINEYSRKNESRDKAGGYAIQGGAAKFVEEIHGEYTNVVGLPLGRLTQLINDEF